MRVLPLLTATALVASTLACGESPAPAEDSADAVVEPAAPADTALAAPPTATPVDTPPSGETTLLREIPNGSPMPAASRTGIPPYPGAIVHTRFPSERPGFGSFEAFTPDSTATVVAYFDTTLGRQWVKTDARDTKIYELGDRAAITVTPWNPEEMPERFRDVETLNTASTVIGVAWRTGSSP